MIIASRIYLPEPAAASFRLGALAEALAAAGERVRILTTTAPGASELRSPPGVDVRRFPVLRDSQGYVRGYVHYMTFDIPLALRLLTARRPAVVVSEPPPTTGAVVRWVCAARRIPYVHYAADIWSDAAESTTAPAPIVRAVRALEQSVVSHASAVLSVNDGVTERLESWGGPPNVTTVGNGVDVEEFTLEGPQHALAGPYFVYAGTASEIQGAAVFVHALERVLNEFPDTHLVFVGLGVDIDALREAAARLPEGRVLFLGRESAAGTAQWLRGARASLASVRPGLGYDFMIPTKMYASLACGTPVIYAGPGPSRTIIGGNDLGWAVDHDIEAVAEAMVAALRTDLTAQRRQGLREWVTRNASLRSVAARASQVVLGARTSAGQRD